MDYPTEERPGLTLLGEPHTGNAWRTVHGRRGDLWSRHLSAIPGTVPLVDPSSICPLASHYSCYPVLLMVICGTVNLGHVLGLPKPPNPCFHNNL